jgi:hypothetical protein
MWMSQHTVLVLDARGWKSSDVRKKLRTYVYTTKFN